MVAKRFKLFLGPLLVLSFLGLATAQSGMPWEGKIESKILTDLKQQEKATFFVVMKEQADTRAAGAVSDWNAKGQIMLSTLKATADRTQQPILDGLAKKDEGTEVRGFWIVNAIRVTTRSEKLIQELAARSDVEYLYADVPLQIPTPTPGSEKPKLPSVEWGIERIRAPQVWADLGVRGEGIVVANIDSGVEFSHPALVRQYRGNLGERFDHNYNWYDPTGLCPSGTPCDTSTSGHGTHTMGTMVGEDGDPGPNQIGVAPGARWIAAKGCESSTHCSPSALLAAGEWVLAPRDLSGQNLRPDLRPHIVNNSWGGSTSTLYRTMVTNWIAAGIFPVFSNGNDGPACGTVGSPGSYPESFGVGATDSDDQIAGFSSRGVSPFDDVSKPNVSAPGVNVRSSVRNGGYSALSGTSMAAPHVAGTVALMWSAGPPILGDIRTTADLLQSSARFRPSTECGPAGPPNSAYGWGIIDALAAVQPLVTGGVLQGRVMTTPGGDPIPGAQVQAVGPVTRTGLTTGEGSYRLILEAGTYNLRVSAFGYLPAQVNGIQIQKKQTLTQSFSLAEAPRYQVSGFVLADADGRPLTDVEVKILGTPLPAVRTNGEGYYEFPGTVPAGAYDIQAKPKAGCWGTFIQGLMVHAATALDFALPPKRDNFGYTCQDDVPFNWVRGEQEVTIFGIGSQEVPLPFPFRFYGQTYNRVYIASTGNANFRAESSPVLATCLPDRSVTHSILPLWAGISILPFDEGAIFTKAEGTAPNRRFIIEWRNVKILTAPPGSVATFEAILEETSGNITFQYNRTDGGADGSVATIGIEDQTGNTALQYSCREGVLSAGKAITFFYP